MPTARAQASGRLGRRITLAFLVFGATLTIGLGLSLTFILDSVESRLIDDTLREELAHYRNQVETARALGNFNSRTTIIHVTPLDHPSEVPPYLRHLPPGSSTITRAGRNYRVLVDEIDGVRYTVQYDESSMRDHDRSFIRLVWASSIAGLLLALAIGWYLGRRLSRPVFKLANAINSLKEHPDSSLDLSEYRDDEIGMLAGQLKHYHEELRALLQREKEFSGNVSHELRTPLTNISLAAEMLAGRSSLAATDLARVARIQRATREMSELVDTFLVLAQVDSGINTQVSAVELAPIVADVVEQQRVWLGDKDVTVDIVETHDTRVTAPTRVISVLIANLVRNAFRYTRKGTVTITIAVDTISVIDTGVGIDVPDQSQLFERHVRGNTGDGAGLGLSIVQRICERYGWTVRVDSTPGQGSRFTVWFNIDQKIPSNTSSDNMS
ncbi:MAG TPA: HAMP domain-containing sensor histidine kinase [Woeseiaceae bacterium]|nr:HAMP domain-containing sensor histidine kinase [Woeseiaceae bacterium]